MMASTEPFVRAARLATRQIHGVVVSAGTMDRTVKVRVGGRIWNDQVKKHFNRPTTHLVHDPNNSLITGDVVAIAPGWPTSQHKRHVVTAILAAATTPAESRPPIPTLEERIAEYEAKREKKLERRAVRDEQAAAARAAAKEEKKRSKREKAEAAANWVPKSKKESLERGKKEGKADL